MGLIDQTSSQYYSGQVVYTPTGNVANAVIWPDTMTPLIWNTSATPTSFDNFKIYVDNVEQTPTTSPYFLTHELVTTITNGVQTQTLTITSQPNPAGGATTPIPNSSLITVRLKSQSLWDNYKEYEYITLKDIVNNFMVAYVGAGKLIPSV